MLDKNAARSTRMAVHWARTLGVLVLSPWLLVSGELACAPLTLEQAWQQARQANPRLRAAVAELTAAEGQLQDAGRPLWNNPEMSAEWRNRDINEVGESGRKNEGTVGFAQIFETGGQQGLRRKIAAHNIDAVRATVAETRREVKAEVELRFVEVLALQLRVETEAQTLKLIEDASALVQKRLKAGQDNRLDANIARVEAERARNQVKVLREQLIEARAVLATLLQLAPGTLPEVAGALDTPKPFYTVETLLQSVPQRPVLRVVEQRERAARSQLDLERRSNYPDITLGLSYGQEKGLAGRDNITALSVSIPLPLFRRNATGIGRAVSDLTQAQINRQAIDRDVRAQVLALWERAQSLRARIEQISAVTLPLLEENQRLSLRALRVGEISLPQLLLVSRQLFDARRDLIEAQSELRLTTALLEAAAGWPPVSGVNDFTARRAQHNGVPQ